MHCSNVASPVGILITMLLAWSYVINHFAVAFFFLVQLLSLLIMYIQSKNDPKSILTNFSKLTCCLLTHHSTSRAVTMYTVWVVNNYLPVTSPNELAKKRYKECN